jgi:hypothetical protein
MGDHLPARSQEPYIKQQLRALRYVGKWGKWSENSMCNLANNSSVTFNSNVYASEFWSPTYPLATYLTSTLPAGPGHRSDEPPNATIDLLLIWSMLSDIGARHRPRGLRSPIMRLDILYDVDSPSSDSSSSEYQSSPLGCTPGRHTATPTGPVVACWGTAQRARACALALTLTG